MNETLDKIRTLAIQLYNANLRRKKKHGPDIWGTPTEWRDLPSESIEVWDAVALEAIKRLRESDAEADKARLDWLENRTREEAFSEQRVSFQFPIHLSLRQAIDAARNAPPVKKTVIERPE